MSFFKIQAVLLGRAKQRHDCDPPPVLVEHGGKQQLLKEQEAQVYSGRVVRGPKEIL